MDEKDEFAPGPQEPGRLWNPRIGVAPNTRTILADCEIKTLVGERRPLGVPQMQRKGETVLRLQPPRRRQLTRRVVDPNRPRSPPRQPRRDVGGATTELDGILPGQIV